MALTSVEVLPMRDAIAILAFVSFLPYSGRAAVCEGSKHPGVTAIYLADTTKADSTAARWVSGFRERIQKSAPYCLIQDKDKSAMVMSVIGMDADANRNATAISIAIYSSKESLFLDHWMYVADRDSLESSSDRAVAALEREIKELKRLRLIR